MWSKWQEISRIISAKPSTENRLVIAYRWESMVDKKQTLPLMSMKSSKYPRSHYDDGHITRVNLMKSLNFILIIRNRYNI